MDIAMEHRPLGRAGIRVSAIGLGTNQFGGKVDDAGVEAILETAHALGVDFLDTADIYQEGRSEEALGRALAGSRRDRFLIATKVGMRAGDGPNDAGASRHRIVAGVEASLKRLRTDRIDLYQIHQWDDRTPIDETLRALDDVVRQGKVRYIGASNFLGWQLAHANLLAELRGLEPFVTIQPHWHLLERKVEDEIVPYCRAHRVGIIPYFPLAGGFLTGKYRRGRPAPKGSRGETAAYVKRYLTDANHDRIEKLEDWSRKRGHSLIELAVGWLLAHPEVASVIAGATRPAQLEENVRGVTLNLTAGEMEEIQEILEPGSTGD